MVFDLTTHCLHNPYPEGMKLPDPSNTETHTHSEAKAKNSPHKNKRAFILSFPGNSCLYDFFPTWIQGFKMQRNSHTLATGIYTLPL